MWVRLRANTDRYKLDLSASFGDMNAKIRELFSSFAFCASFIDKHLYGSYAYTH
jgi:hypothetical protein